MFTPLIPSLPAFNDAGQPYSPRYGDVYHAAQGAIEQARHVFLAGNGLPGRWRGRARFTVCETGFGLGMTFLTLWRAWREDPQRCRRLHVVSVEAHPFAREHLAELLTSRLPADWREQAQQLIAQWPPLLPGLHRLDFDGGAVTLTLAFGQAESVVPQLSLAADAFFLDGFDPAGNPEMWSEALMKSLARLAARDATAATWASAGAVRRALQAAGFEVEKAEGFAGKRHMTVARFASKAPRHVPAVRTFAERHAVVIGAGVAGAGVARGLALRGWRVTVLDAAGGQSPERPGHLAAALTPLLAKDDNARARLTRAGALRAAHRWAPWLDGNIVARCGTVQQAKSDERAAEMRAMLELLQFPPDWVRAVTAEEAGALAGCATARGGAYFPGGLRVRPRLLCGALLDHPAIAVRPGRAGRVEAEFDDVPGGCLWRVVDERGAELAIAEVAVVANSVDAPRLLRASGWGRGAEPPRFFQQKALAGQITLLPAGGGWPGPRCVVAGDGYVLPAAEGWSVAGSTYVHDAAEAVETAEGHALNLERAVRLLPGLGREMPGNGIFSGWAGWRAVLPGRLPVIGEMPGAMGLWVASGYASRGLSWAALAGDLIAAQLENEPLMLERELLQMVAWR